MSTPKEVGDALLVLAAGLLVDPPARQYVTVAPPGMIWPGCEHLSVHVRTLVPVQPTLTSSPQSPRLPCGLTLNRLDVCIQVARCYPKQQGNAGPDEAEIDVAAATILDDGWRLYRGVDQAAIDSVAAAGCTVYAGPSVEWRRPSGGMVDVVACLTLDITPGPDGS